MKKIIAVLFLLSIVFGLCSCQQPELELGGRYFVLGQNTQTESIVFTEFSALFTYKNGTTQMFDWCIRNDYESNESFKVISIDTLLFGITTAPRGMLRLFPLFGETEYSNLYLKKE